jgi:ABC-type transport system involved in multi-copper enzyme maturation permease subunit
MILHIIRKEILQSFLNLRMPLTLILVTAVMIFSAFLFIEDYQQQLADYGRNVNGSLQGLAQRADGTWLTIYSTLSCYEQPVYMAPTRLAFLSEGSEKELPNAFQVSAFWISGPIKNLRENRLLRKFKDVDWVFVVSVIMSFAAIVLSYDGISGEREKGTLRLCMSNPVPRSIMILGKYIGTMILLIVPLLVGMLSSLIIITTSDKINIMGEDWIRIALVIIFSTLYLSIFVMLGLFVSSMFSSSDASLVILLLVWAVIVVIIPNIGGTVVTSLSELPSKETVSRDAQEARARAYDEYNARHPNAGEWYLIGWWLAYGEELARALEGNDALMRVYDRYWNQMVAQVRFGRNVTRISPTGVYQQAAEALVGSGIDHYENFLKQVRRYKTELRQFLLDHYPLDPHRSYSEDMDTLKEALSTKIFTATDVPKFRDEPISVEDSMKNSLLDIAILLTFNVFFFMAAHISFLYQDIT